MTVSEDGGWGLFVFFFSVPLEKDVSCEDGDSVSGRSGAVEVAFSISVLLPFFFFLSAVRSMLLSVQSNVLVVFVCLDAAEEGSG